MFCLALGSGVRRNPLSVRGAAVASIDVIPAEAGIQMRWLWLEPRRQRLWIPAFAGMTGRGDRSAGVLLRRQEPRVVGRRRRCSA